MDISKALDELMLELPRGEIELRDDRKKTKWAVELEPFLISRFPVTQELYAAVLQRDPSCFKGARRPVETVSWFDAAAFCNRLSEILGLRPCYLVNSEGADIDESANGFRLPSEAQWEYACRADSGKVRYGEIDEIAWYAGNSEGCTHDVGLKAPNGWGVYDMLGNVWEWCEDLYDVEVYGTYRVFRGGGWNDEERGCLASNRRRSHPTYAIDDLGFRIARSRVKS
ncbi:MAG TPA: formylglycine-generating enzyme family protein [Oligoflexus sp.]|uniref:formylglycine-generating enzyme family protein n=1 Tax=Oligoflexus sp. TaxID=1971216 RepID=UPI002D7F250F|nr:formylglycine-generating enzyme family protein [Oligoflexus sp.]HET9240676.1 formylglycine-generating enzyme family protein [Oligoflexus sp.]